MTKTIAVHDAQIRFPELLTFTQEGNEVIIVEDNKPLARLVPINPLDQPRKADLNKGKIRMSEDFDAALPDEFWMGLK